MKIRFKEGKSIGEERGDFGQKDTEASKFSLIPDSEYDYFRASRKYR